MNVAEWSQVEGRGSALLAGTPLVRLARLGQGLPGRIAVKVESKNPGGSVKDRVAAALVADAERSGALGPGGSFVAATSGNTGVSLAQLAAAKGYRAHLVVPEPWARERLALLLYLGADVSLTEGTSLGPARERARALASTRGAVLLDQFTSPANVDAHRLGTARELARQLDAPLQAFVAGVGTGGTIVGVALGLREALGERPPRIVAVEPAASAVLSGGRPGAHGIQGIGAGFVPPLYRADVVDEVVPVTDDEAWAATQRLAREEGILAGVSSGAALVAALREAARPEAAGKLVVTLVCDSGERYVSVPDASAPPRAIARPKAARKVPSR